MSLIIHHTTGIIIQDGTATTGLIQHSGTTGIFMLMSTDTSHLIIVTPDTFIFLTTGTITYGGMIMPADIPTELLQNAMKVLTTNMN
jgi:hypothetical protein